jgi:hypothetical protein
MKNVRELDKQRLEKLNKGNKKTVQKKEKVVETRKIKQTTIDTISYERVLSEYVILLEPPPLSFFVTLPTYNSFAYYEYFL